MEPLTEQLQISIRLQELKKANERLVERRERDFMRFNNNLIKISKLRKRALELDELIAEQSQQEY